MAFLVFVLSLVLLAVFLCLAGAKDPFRFLTAGQQRPGAKTCSFGSWCRPAGWTQVSNCGPA